MVRPRSRLLAQSAASALESFGPEGSEAIEDLLQLFDSQQSPPSVNLPQAPTWWLRNLDLIRVLGSVGCHSPAIIDWLTQRFQQSVDNEDSWERHECLLALALAGPRAASSLSVLLANLDEVALNPVVAIGPAAVQPLINMLTDVERDLLEPILGAIGSMAPPPSVLPSLAPFLDDVRCSQRRWCLCCYCHHLGRDCAGL